MKIKGFDKDLKCRGFQFEIGKTYDTGADENKLELCTDTVFHYCDSLRHVHEHYSTNPKANNRFCEIEVLGKEVSDDKKCGSNKIKIVREITGKELDALRGICNGNSGIFNTGNRNIGDRNTGTFNSCNFSSGFFCTEEPKARVFDIETDMTVSEFYRSRHWILITRYPLLLTEWVSYTDEEKNASKEKELIGGYMKKYTFKEACAAWWGCYSAEEQKEFLKIPNFDKDKFKAITGIEVK